MKRLFPSFFGLQGDIESRLMKLAAGFLFLYSLILTLSPAVRVHSWNTTYRWMHWIGFTVWLIGFSLIYRRLNHYLPEHDPYLLPLSALLVGWGLLTIWRLDSTFGIRQTIWLVIGLVIMEAGMHFPSILNSLRRYKYIWLTIGLALTGLTFILGQFPSGVGPQLWLGCCGLYFQPTEPLKLLLIVYLAAYLADQLPVSFSFTQLLAPTLVVVGAAALMLVAQRDLGTATLIVAIYALLLYIASGKRRVLAISALALLAAGITGYRTFDVIRLRVDAWLNPWADPVNRSFQIVQALISIASGRLLGSGPGLGSPGLVPIAHSDYIASAIAEETGLVGMVALILVFILLIFRGFQIGLRTNSLYLRLLAFGISIYWGAQAILILGGNLRLLPLTGVTLPFVSYGGSSLTTAFISLTILFIINQPEETPVIHTFKPQPLLVTGGLFLAGFAALAVLAGWWGVVRTDALQNRSDNLRWIINDRYVQRGSILDRRNQPIALTVGSSGQFTRELTYPPLSSIIGYSNPQYGHAGLEDSLNLYLVGLQANSTSAIWMANLIYSQPPEGLNVRLTLDLNLQTRADALLGEHTGAAVLLNAKTGEILAMASHPYFDSNLLKENWQTWSQSESAPLLNRTVQGQYPVGTTLGPFLYAWVNPQRDLPASAASSTYTTNATTLECTRAPSTPLTWESALSAGCPAALAALGDEITPTQFKALYQALGFYSTPEIRLPAFTASETTITDTRLEAIGASELRVSPLQMALAAATLSNQGTRPGPLLAASVETPHQGWVVLPSAAPTQVFADPPAANELDKFNNGDLPTWETTGKAVEQDKIFTWYIGGTLPNWQGQPLAMAVLLEEDDAALAQFIGQNIFEAALTPE